MKKFLKSCLRIILAVLTIAFLTWVCVYWDPLIYEYDINLYLIFCILFLIVYLILVFNTFRSQSWARQILIFIWSIVWVLLIYTLFFFIIWLRIRNNIDNGLSVDKFKLYILILISILLSIYWIMLIRVFKTENKEDKKKRKLLVIILLPFMLAGTRAWLTRAWAIPNRFEIERLCPWKRVIMYGDCVDCQWAYYWWFINRNKWDTLPEKNWVRCCEWSYNVIELMNDKPIIYLYPTSEIQINVKLWTPENLSHTYPKYNSKKWRNVIAQPNWDLKDIDTWRKLYALYWEWKNENSTNFDEWFVVEWKDTIPFLEEKLALLWLNEREAEEFIVYWLPQMEDNKYNLIRFETKEEQDENMLLNITPTPDTVIRVMMDWKAIEEPIDIPEQELTTPERTWFAVVEWWGSPRN